VKEKKERKKKKKKKNKTKNTDQYHSNCKIFTFENILQKIIQRLYKINNVEEFHEHHIWL
jgi:GTP1/Obg family GTP-binding protein